MFHMCESWVLLTVENKYVSHSSDKDHLNISCVIMITQSKWWPVSNQIQY